MIEDRGHALRWTCPECGSRVTGAALDLDAAEGALIEGVREHSRLHATEPNATAQTTGWLAAAGHLVELWGGPFDGDKVWCPPGDLPDAIGVHRTVDGAVVPIRSATARLLPHVETYRLSSYLVSELATAPGDGRARYNYDGRPR